MKGSVKIGIVVVYLTLLYILKVTISNIIPPTIWDMGIVIGIGLIYLGFNIIDAK